MIRIIHTMIMIILCYDWDRCSFIIYKITFKQKISHQLFTSFRKQHKRPISGQNAGKNYNFVLRKEVAIG